jgi:hypothetical protein
LRLAADVPISGGTAKGDMQGQSLVDECWPNSKLEYYGLGIFTAVTPHKVYLEVVKILEFELTARKLKLSKCIQIKKTLLYF